MICSLDGKYQVFDSGPEGHLVRVIPSPDGFYMLVEAIHPPYSFLHNYHRFPYRVEVWDMSALTEAELSNSEITRFNFKRGSGWLVILVMMVLFVVCCLLFVVVEKMHSLKPRPINLNSFQFNHLVVCITKP